ncbi:hypothetical protein EHQ96_03400 [Leptospira levettii]|uniref:Lipoprotein n=1 Tax=Leptospira levettii TaxID=2023178 RepID=A0ABY2ML50_9LEPT|nr:hypothetical protein [Leptospira levettii]TGL13415.1 hypothetical protein EHQ39_03375 [Leptospira levettii]TGL68482.1 hypothetical protein EHQ60_14350 [Leptospira levettii]TGM30658.1 hypothetical protein EHQ71_10315 [Leptospira levettii]TGM70792.1 hypothetical protein EHQ96_03400 [Leptospira levettii]TGM85774.1 hypothetical protein EHR00_02360 [Leptospira levettii]
MKKFLIRILPLLLVGSVIGNCVYSELRTPGLAANMTQYVMNSDDYQIIGPVETQGEFVTWFLVVLTGETGYSDLLKQAREKGGDDIINYRFEIRQKSILLVVWNRVIWNASAIAIKYRDKIKK